MTAAAITQLPLAAGHALATTLGRAALWGLARYARAPLSNTAIAALAVFSLLAADNALYWQKHRHPAPLFGPPEQTEVAELGPMPVIPAVRTKPRPKRAVVQTITGSVPANPAVASGPIGNDEVLALQRRLTELGIFSGKLDGLYGPRTATAIRKFEEGHGLKPEGMLTRDVLAAILAAPLSRVPAIPSAPPAAAEPSLPDPAPAQPVMVVALPGDGAPHALGSSTTSLPPATAQAATMQALPAPKPLTASIAPQAAAPVTQRPLPQTADEALEIASGIAADAVDAVGDAVNGDIQLGPASPSQPMPPQAAESQMAMAPLADEGTDEGEDVAEAPIAETDAGSADAAPLGSGDPVADIVTAEMDPVATTPVAAVDSKDPKLVAKVQRGLASLGFLSGQIDGKPGEATARAIRNFEVWNNFEVTGRVTPGLLKLLIAAGAEI